MKLALIRRQFSATGGAEMYLQRLLEALAQAGHELHLLTESWDQKLPGVSLHQLPSGGSRAERPVRFADAVQRELAGHKFDCVFSLERTRQQDVYRAGDGVHRVWLQRRKQFAPVWKKPFVGLGAFHRNVLQLEAETFDPRNTRRIIVNSEMVKGEILENFSFPSDRIHLVRNGVELARFQGGDRSAVRRQFGVSDDDFLLLFVGSGWERKGLKYLLAALRSIHQYGFAQGLAEGIRQFGEVAHEVVPQLEITELIPNAGGSSPHLQPEKLKLLVIGKGTKPLDAPRNAIFAGSMTNVENAYAAADLFVFLPIYEPSANVVIEALAAGLPVVTTAQNGASEMIEETVNGTVIENPTDIASVVEAIAYWWSRRFYVPPVHAADLSLDRNVLETLAVLELAAKEKKPDTG